MRGRVLDLIVGTSTSGVIALGAGLLRLTLDGVAAVRRDGGRCSSRTGTTTCCAAGGARRREAFERVMSDMLGPEASRPLYAAAAHPGGTPPARRTTGTRRSKNNFGKASSPSARVPGVSLVSRQPATLVLLRCATAAAATREPPPASAGRARMGAVDALRATTAAPWYMEELAMEKELGLGRARPARDFGEEDDGAATSASAAEETLHTSQTRTVGAKDDAFVRRDERLTHDAFFGADADAGAPETDLEKTETAFLSEKASEAVTSARDASRVESSLRFIDGAIACNNPTSVGIFEARALFGREVPLCVVSLGTGAAVPREPRRARRTSAT